MIRTVVRHCRLLAMSLLLAASAAPAGADTVIPNFWDTRERLPKPELGELVRLRFLTTTDFPPFNYLDNEGRLSGFHVDLARAICRELDILDRCQIQALPWAELEEALASGQGEAILAGIAVTAQSRQRLGFSRPYLKLPARFVMARSGAASEPIAENLAERRVGVIDGSAHERLLRDLFPQLRPVVYSRRDWMLGDLKEGNVDAVLGDGMQLSFWLASAEAEACCRFAGGPYLSPEHLGYGLSVAAKPDDDRILGAINFALKEIGAKGRFAELYLRYFPVGFF